MTSQSKMVHSTQAVLPTPISQTSNLANTHTAATEDETLSTDDEYDVHIGTATLQPMCRFPVQRVFIRRNTVASRSRTAPATPARSTTPYPTTERAEERADSPPPPPIPERSLRRAKPLPALQTGVEMGMERDTKRDGIVLPLPLPPRAPGIKKPILEIPTVLSQKTTIVLSAPPRRRVPTLPTPTPTQPAQPAQPHYTMEQLMASVGAAYSSSVYSSDEEENHMDRGAMQLMYAEHQAGALVFPPSPPIPTFPAEEEEKYEEEVFERQKKFFEVLVPETRAFRSSFEEESRGRDVDDLLDMFPTLPQTKAERRKVGEDSLMRALLDESILGSSETTDTEPAKTELLRATAPTSMPEGRVQQYDFIDAEAWLLEEKQNEIANLHVNQFTLLGQGWTVVEGGGSSIHSTPSPLHSPSLQDGSMDGMLYSPAENPFLSDEFPDSIEETQREFESQVGLAGLDVDALVADAQTPGSQLQDTDDEKGEPEFLMLSPHTPRKECGCFHCEEHRRPVRPTDVALDPSQWCYCLDCQIFREEAANTAYWNAQFAKLDAEVKEARAEEKRRKAGLLKRKHSDDSEPGDASKPKKACRLGHWVRKHLACPNPDE